MYRKPHADARFIPAAPRQVEPEFIRRQGQFDCDRSASWTRHGPAAEIFGRTQEITAGGRFKMTVSAFGIDDILMQFSIMKEKHLCDKGKHIVKVVNQLPRKLVLSLKGKK